MKTLTSYSALNQMAKYISTAVIAIFLCISSSVQAQDNNALSLLKSMSDYVKSQQHIGLTFDSDIEVITPQLEKIQFTNSGSALLSRPNKLYAHRVGGYAEVELYYNGKTVSVYGKSLNAFAQFSGPGSIDELIEALRVGHGVAMPGADLFLTHAYETLVAGVMEAKHIGQGVINGRVCEHLAFRNHDTDWQLWIESGRYPVPRKMVITSKTINSAPQYTIRIVDWNTAVRPQADAFVFHPPQGARLLEPGALIELDELPQSSLPGGEK
jgi:hypothetical protein